MTLHICRFLARAQTGSSLTPFLYQTRTLTAPNRPYRRIRAHSRFPYSTAWSARNDTAQDEIDQVGHDDSEKTNATDPSGERMSGGSTKPRGGYLRRRAAMASKAKKPKSSQRPRRTITDQEKGAFTGLLEQLDRMRREQKEKAVADDTGETPQPQPPPPAPAPIEDGKNEMSNVSSIFEEVMRGIRRRRIRRAWMEQLDEERRDKPVQEPSEVDRGEQIGTGLDRVTERGEQVGTGVARVTERPEQVGAEATEDTEPPEPNQPTQSEEIRIPMTVAIDTITHRESARIEDALREAIDAGRGDTGVWEVCKERIFSMLQYLDTVQESEQSHSPEPNSLSVSSESKSPEIPHHPEKMQSLDERGHKEAAGENLQLPKDNVTKPRVTSGPLAIPHWVPVESVVSVVYPRLLLVAFRLISTNFPKSPLVAQFRSSIKAHGRMSSVVGASSDLYNELIFFYWRGCNDLPAVVSLLEEMEVTGIEPNRRTAQLLTKIVKQRNDDLRRESGRRQAGEQPSKNLWWDMVPNRKALHQLLGPDGWVEKMRARVKQLREMAKEEEIRLRARRGQSGVRD